jgi:hypothetical protein
VADEDDACALVRAFEELLDELVVGRQRQRDVRADVARGEVLEEQVVRPVLEIRREHLVIRPELQRARRRVHRRGRVRNEDEVVRRCSDVGGERGARLRQPFWQLPVEELDRLPLHLALKLLVPLEDGAWAGAERAVVQEDDVGVEEELRPHGSRERATARWGSCSPAARARA